MLEDPQWDVIQLLCGRISNARASRDWELVIGTAKDLSEAVAKMVLDARGETYGNSTGFQQLVTAAHSALSRQPGHGLATDAPVRNMAQAAKSLVLALGELRNSHGSGHGRTHPAEVIAEHADVSADAGLLWVRWALRRLDVVVDGRLADLIRDLRDSTFRRGELARRLEAADLPSLDDAEVRRLGVSVGRRATTHTFNVIEDGVDADAVRALPEQYQVGLFEGAILDADGYLRSSPTVLESVIDVIHTVEEELLAGVANQVLDSARHADFAYSFVSDDRCAVANIVMRRSGDLPLQAQRPIEELAHLIYP